MAMPISLVTRVETMRVIQRTSPFTMITLPPSCSLISTSWLFGGRFMEILIPDRDMSTTIAGLSSRLESILFLTRISFLFSMSHPPPVPLQGKSGLPLV